MAAAENEGFGEGEGVRGARTEGGVVHVAAEELGIVGASGGDGGDAGVEEEVFWGRWRGSGVRRGLRIGASELGDGGADGVELVEKVIGDWGVVDGGPRDGARVPRGGEKVVQREDVGGHHGEQKEKVQPHPDPHSSCSFSFSFSF